MCYSAQIQADYRKFVRMFGATMSIKEFTRLFFERAEGSKAKIPKAMEDAFSEPQSQEEREVKTLIDKFSVEQLATLEQEEFIRRARLPNADRSLPTKVTRAPIER